MQNEEGQMMDLYIPRKCSATNRLITAKDHASVQINVGHLDENGMYTGQYTTFALFGFIRAQKFLPFLPREMGEVCPRGICASPMHMVTLDAYELIQYPYTKAIASHRPLRTKVM